MTASQRQPPHTPSASPQYGAGRKIHRIPSSACLSRCPPPHADSPTPGLHSISRLELYKSSLELYSLSLYLYNSSLEIESGSDPGESRTGSSEAEAAHAACNLLIFTCPNTVFRRTSANPVHWQNRKDATLPAISCERCGIFHVRYGPEGQFSK